MTTGSKPYNATESLIDGLPCVQAAGGMDGWLREVVAETKTKVMAEIDEYRGKDELTIVDHCYDVLCDVMLRRVTADITAAVKVVLLSQVKAGNLYERYANQQPSNEEGGES